MTDEPTLTDEERERAWEVNALLMALHNEDTDYCQVLVEESPDAPSLLIMAVGMLKLMTDTLIEAVNEAGVPLMEDKQLEFRDLIQLSAEALMEDAAGA